MKSVAQAAMAANRKPVTDFADEQADCFFNKKDIFWAGTVFFISYAFYLFSLFPTITTEDSGEFTAAAYTAGIAHPPGYPLFVIMAKIFTWLIPFGNIGWRVNLFSAFMAAATVATVYFLMRLLTKDPAVGITTALFFAAGGIFWSQAVRAEVYSLHTFLMVLVIFLAVLWFFENSFERERHARKTILWLAFIYGLSLTNHQLMFLIGPPLAIFVLIVKPRIILDYRLLAKIILVFLLGLSLYLYLPLRASYKPEVNWGNPVTWENFWTHVGRQAYGDDGPSSVQKAAAEAAAGATAQESASVQQTAQPQAQNTSIHPSPLANFIRFNVYEFWIRFMQVLDGNYNWVISILSLFGFVFLWIRSQKLFWLFLTLTIFNSTILSALVGVGNTDKLAMRFFTDRPFFIPLLLLTVILGGCGIRYLTSLAYQAGKRTAPAQKRAKGIYVLMGLLLIPFIYGFKAQNQSDNYMAYDLAKTTLALLPQGAILHSENSDNTILPILYLQIVERYRPDVKIYINMPGSIYNFFRDQQHMADENPGKRLFTDWPFAYYPGYKYLFMGPVAEIIPDTADDNNADALARLSKTNIRGFNKPNPDYFHAYLRARYLLDLGLANFRSPEKQDELFKESFASAPESQYITGQLIGYTYLMKSRFAEAIPYLQAALKMMPDEYSLNFQLALSYIMSGSADKAHQLIEAQKADFRALLLKELKSLASQMPDKYPALALFLMAESN